LKAILTIILSCFCLASLKADDERIWMKAKINGQPVRFIFDTGSGFNLILFSNSAQRLGLKVSPTNRKAFDGKIATGTTELCNLDVGVTNVKSSLNVVDMPAPFKWDADGLVGWPAMTNNILQFDVEKGIATIISNVPEETVEWTKLRVKTNSDLLDLEIPTHDGGAAILGVDTGADDGLKLNPQEWREWKSSHPKQQITLDSYYTPSIGIVVKEEAWSDKISVGKVVLTDVPIQEADEADVNAGTFPDAKYEATIGLAALKRLDVIIDGRHGVAYLHPKNTPPSSYPHNRLGAAFVPKDLQSDDLIAHVIEDSPAYEAGIRNGDVLLKIDEQDVTSWRDPNIKINTIFFERPAGAKVKLTLKRDDKIFKTTAVLRNILPPDSTKN
jgi:hypothetical protein